MTNLGVFLRKIRLDRRELMKDMATNLGVSSAFLSALENGKKKVPANFVDSFCRVYNLNDSQRDDLASAAEESLQEVRLNLVNTTPAQHQAAVSFAKALNGLTDDEISQIMRVFERRKRKGEKS